MSLADVFDVNPTEVVLEIPVSTEEKQLPVVAEVSDDTENIVDTDFHAARTNQHDLLTMGMASLNTAMRIAAETEEPRAIEVLSGLLKTVSEMNKQLVVMSKDREEVKNERNKRTAKPQQENPSIGHQNNVFVASSADINKLLAEKMKEIK